MPINRPTKQRFIINGYAGSSAWRTMS
jgi:hypothetical protein